MTKELEALKTIIGVIAYVDLRDLDRESIDNSLEIIETALKQLETYNKASSIIDNLPQSKIIVNEEGAFDIEDCKDLMLVDKDEFNKKLKVIEIIKKLLSISIIYTKQETHYYASISDKLTQEEYDLLKEVLL